MSIDRFIRLRLAGQSAPSGATAPGNAIEAPATARAATATRTPAIMPVVKSDATHGAAAAGHHAESDASFEALWAQIELSAGTRIYTRRGQGFTYEIEPGYLAVPESGTRIPKSQFKKALGYWPVSGPSRFRGVYAASVVWAVLAALADRPALASAA